MPVNLHDGRRVLIGQRLHEGAMAKLHEVDHEGERMLLKTALEGTPHDALNREVLETEARALSRSGHPNIVAMRGFAGEEGLLLEMLDGPDLRMRVTAPVPFAEAIALTTGILDGLSHLHRHGIVHGDMKPENIVLHRERPVLVDLANAEPPEGGQRMGTPPYCPPEQLDKGAVASPSDDVYAAARILEFLCLGDMPKAVVNADWLDGLPGWVAGWVLDAVHPMPERRFKDAAEAIRRLPPTMLGQKRGDWFIRGGPADGKQLPLRIGRAPDNDICVNDPRVSRYHATLTVSETGEVYLLNHGRSVQPGTLGLLGHKRLGEGEKVVVGGHDVGALQRR